MKKRGKQRLPTLINKVYSFLIFQIASGNNYSQKIYKNNKEKYGIKSKTGVIVRQLEILREENFVTFEVIEDKSKFPMQRKKIYSINHQKVIKEFLNYLRKRKKDLIADSRKFWNTKKESIILYREPSVKLLDNKNFEKTYFKNPYLVLVLNELFKVMSFHKTKTLKDAFDKIIEDPLRPLEYWSGWRLGTESRKITNKQKEKSELKHLESHAQNKPMKFKKLTKKGLDILNQLSLQINLDKDKLKKADKELKDYDVLMEICFKLSLDPIDDKINEIKGVLIKKILEKNKKVLK